MIPHRSSSVALRGATRVAGLCYIVVISLGLAQAAFVSSRLPAFDDPVAALGGARTAPLAGGGLVGVRAPLRDDEEPVVRPYWLVDDVQAAVAGIEEKGGTIALPPMELPGHGTIAIYLLGGSDHGLWQP